jgi:hypothetical protein
MRVFGNTKSTVTILSNFKFCCQREKKNCVPFIGIIVQQPTSFVETFVNSVSSHKLMHWHEVALNQSVLLKHTIPVALQTVTPRIGYKNGTHLQNFNARLMRQSILHKFPV